MVGRRWDGDERGEGIADARLFAPGLEDLLREMRSPGWVAEQPELHLLPHVERACESLPLQLVGAHATEDGSFDIECHWTSEIQRIAAVRAAVFALVGGLAEAHTYVRQREGDTESSESVTFEVVTGMLGEESRFAPHGHTIRVHVTGVRRVQAGEPES